MGSVVHLLQSSYSQRIEEESRRRVGGSRSEGDPPKPCRRREAVEDHHDQPRGTESALLRCFAYLREVGLRELEQKSEKLQDGGQDARVDLLLERLDLRAVRLKKECS